MAAPKVTLLSFTPNPREVVFALWEASKNEGKLWTVEEVLEQNPVNVDGLNAEKLFWKVLKQKIPIGEMVSFTFVLENVSVSFREQMVRHRIGTKVGQNVGVDILPDIADSSWWSQSMRIQNMGKFADNDGYRTPPSLEGKTATFQGNEVEAKTLFHSTMKGIQEVYKSLVAAGVPMEDARELIPLGAQHRISWTINLQSLLHVMGERGCWILQMGLWGPIITGMVNELATKVHPAFRDLVKPPCIGGDGCFKSCLYQHENERRITQEDKLPICPLYVVRDQSGAEKHFGKSGESIEQRAISLKRGTTNIAVAQHDEMMRRAEEYRALWGHDPFTWDEK
jgi:hypothetical protein